MAVIALANAKGPTGVTTTGLAFTLAWSRTCVVLAECDPAGRGIAAGHLHHRLPDGGQALLRMAATGRGQVDGDIWEHLIDLDPPGRRRLLLPGVATPDQATILASRWHHLGQAFASLEHLRRGYHVIVDCGRLDTPHAPWPLLRQADLTLLVVRPTSASLAATEATAAAMTAVTEPGDDRLGLIVVGGGNRPDRGVSERLGMPVVAHLPDDDRSARVLARGGTLRAHRPLPRAAAAAESEIMKRIARRRERLREAGGWRPIQVLG